MIILTLAFGRVGFRLSLGNGQTETFCPYMVRPVKGFILTISGYLTSLRAEKSLAALMCNLSKAVLCGVTSDHLCWGMEDFRLQITVLAPGVSFAL